MIEDKPNYWGTPLEDWQQQNLDPLTQELGRKLVARSCTVPNCSHRAGADGYCDTHALDIHQSHQAWEDWKDEQLVLDSYFLPYEEL